MNSFQLVIYKTVKEKQKLNGYIMNKNKKESALQAAGFIEGPEATGLGRIPNIK
jgi:type II secretory pathway component PulC